MDIRVSVALSSRKLSMPVPTPLPNNKPPKDREPQVLHIHLESDTQWKRRAWAG